MAWHHALDVDKRLSAYLQAAGGSSFWTLFCLGEVGLAYGLSNLRWKFVWRGELEAAVAEQIGGSEIVGQAEALVQDYYEPGD